LASREQIQQVLGQWQAGTMDELAVWQWAEQARQELRQAIETQPAARDELARDLLDILAALPYEMLVVEDIVVLLDALANPIAETDLSINMLWNHMDAIDVDTRRDEYIDHPFYGQFSQAD